MSDLVSIKGLPKAFVLIELYNRAKPQGRGFLNYDPAPMTVAQAEEILKDSRIPEGCRMSFDYLKGRVMKVDISGDEINPWGFDRDNGDGAVEQTIIALRRKLGEV